MTLPLVKANEHFSLGDFTLGALGLQGHAPTSTRGHTDRICHGGICHTLGVQGLYHIVFLIGLVKSHIHVLQLTAPTGGKIGTRRRRAMGAGLHDGI